MKSIEVLCFGGPADGYVAEITWNKGTWVSPQRELYLVKRVYVSFEGYKKVLVWHRIDWDLVDKKMIAEMLREKKEEASE